MPKFTALIALLIGACAVDLDTTTSSSDLLGTVCESNGWGCPKPPPKPPGPVCTTKQDGAVYLDAQPANVDHEDGQVTYCHATGAQKNPYILLTTSTDGCSDGHANVNHHPGGNDDIFPTQGCDD